MKVELVEVYQEMLEKIFYLVEEKEASRIVGLIEMIPDDASDLRREFIQNRDQMQRPVYWIAIIRVMKLSYTLRGELQESYDSFVSIYQELSSSKDRTEDESRLYQELGGFLYRVDDLFGDHDRYIHRLILSMRQAIIEDRGISPEMDDQFYRSSLSRETEKKYSPLIDELMDILDQFVEQIRVMTALDRLRSIILPSSSGEPKSSPKNSDE